MMRRWPLLLTMLAASPAASQPIVTSLAPDTVSVSVFRDPDRDEGGEIAPNWLEGFALISETRSVDLPAGEATLRFEGVAEGMIAVSAIVTGLPGGVVQKNRDAALLSPASLLDGSLGNRVHLRRTDRATGKVTEEEAIIRSGPAGAVVLQTAAGYEALRCTGLPETILYDGVPPGLTAKPTLSVTTRSPAAARAMVTLTYLSTGFDWASNYVARVRDDGKTLDLFAWLTVANSNGESFADARLAAIAGTLNQVSDFEELADRPRTPPLRLSCFPTGSGRYGVPRSPPPPPAPPMMMSSAGMEDIVVTGSRMQRAEMMSPLAIVASQEDLGDLKLYRVPIPVTVAANGQKQVALLVKDRVPFRTIYRLRMGLGDEGRAMTPDILLRMENSEAGGLGMPLPGGQAAVFERVGDRDLLVGEGTMRDHAVGEKVDLVIGESSQVRIDVENHVPPKNREHDYRVTVINAKPRPADVEIGFLVDDHEGLDSRIRKLPRRDGLLTWIVRVPANGSKTFRYRAKAED
ncbi:DUF4139 domain-containing protein [Sphingopyxis alaskensis]|jgi:hypothetical protein|uniref:DUF4139 domain-containing protein n=1 Tax=Sphingopyxis alaskensis (strain DSM 13593 / LMG 18877 / RB2256) TaxID=317655 RepID=Q1GPK7_SPHAL|nr:hypothetical protein [Sphingopyxis alaskensis]ABF54415.1 conserved hypothetical protein [Sphingopyxis alaskensis RB2256]MCM3417873.1 hypothetical protein [Sphingopyxis alaskensis]